MMLILYILSTLFFLIYASLIIYYRQSWLSIPVFKDAGTTVPEPGVFVSVIIPARNEEKNILNCLKAVLSQTYPSHLFEIIVADDFSTDDTANLVQSRASENISLISMSSEIPGGTINSYKKKAIEIAIGRAKGSLIVTTDADCIPVNTWLQTIVAFYQKYNPAFIAGSVKYKGAKNFMGIFESLDFMTMQGITGASVYKKFHSMCNGANLAYKKEVFLEVGGFNEIDKIASGDDMLLMYKIFKRYPGGVLYLKSKEAIVQTKPLGNLRSFIHQRIRWSSKADKYEDKNIFWVLLFVYLFNFWFLILALMGIAAVSLNHNSIGIWSALLALLFGKTLIELFFLFPVSGFFGDKNLLKWFLPMQPFHIVYIIVAGWLGKFGSYEWKGRNVK